MRVIVTTASQLPRVPVLSSNERDRQRRKPEPFAHVLMRWQRLCSKQPLQCRTTAVGHTQQLALRGLQQEPDCRGQARPERPKTGPRCPALIGARKGCVLWPAWHEADRSQRPEPLARDSHQRGKHTDAASKSGCPAHRPRRFFGVWEPSNLPAKPRGKPCVFVDCGRTRVRANADRWRHRDRVSLVGRLQRLHSMRCGLMWRYWRASGSRKEPSALTSRVLVGAETGLTFGGFPAMCAHP